MPAVYRTASIKNAAKRLPDDGKKYFGSIGRMSDECRYPPTTGDKCFIRGCPGIPMRGALYCVQHLNYTPLYRD